VLKFFTTLKMGFRVRNERPDPSGTCSHLKEWSVDMVWQVSHEICAGQLKTASQIQKHDFAPMRPQFAHDYLNYRGGGFLHAALVPVLCEAFWLWFQCANCRQPSGS
jgi:hypothetical protein